LASVCESILITQGIEFCWKTYSYAALQACSILTNLEQNKPFGYMEQVEKESLQTDNYTHAVNWFKLKGEFNCSDCTNTGNYFKSFPSEYFTSFCNFQFQKDACSFLFDKAKKECFEKAELSSQACSKAGTGACLETCTIGRDTLNFYVDRVVKPWIPIKFKSTRIDECPAECTEINTIQKIYDVKNLVVGDYYNRECRVTCEKIVQEMIEKKEKMMQIFKIKKNTVLTRIENKQKERDKFDDQHISKTKGMSFRYNRDTIYDAIILMENEIYDDQKVIIEESDLKSKAFEEDMQNQVTSHYASEDGFDYFDEELNVFDLKP
jgi:hypothetical protein